MQKQILAELKELRSVICKLIGTNDLPSKDQFSIEKVDKAAKEFKVLLVKRGEWISEDQLYKYLKGARYGAGKFIREEFKFSNYYKQSHSYYYNRKDIQALSNALKDRNVSLSKYVELRSDQENFKKKIAAATFNKKGSKKKTSYSLPNDLSDIVASESPNPSIEPIKQELRTLEGEFFEYKLSEYIDIFKNSYAMVKFEYSFSKYYPADVKRRCKSWCERFNYANHALELITEKRVKFNPVKEEDMIEL